MAHSASARKRVRQAEKHRTQNASQRSAMRTEVKKVNAAILEGNLEKAQLAYRNAASALDSAADKGLIHKNKASRGKSRLNAKVKALALGNA